MNVAMNHDTLPVPVLESLLATKQRRPCRSLLDMSLYNLAPIISLFLKRDFNKALVGEKVNRGAGYGLEIPCEY